jgi:hypothetical protein
MNTEIWSSSSGLIELEISLDQANGAYHQGQCDDDVKALSNEPDIQSQLAKLNPETVRNELREYGAWDEKELADHDQNLQRLLWLAAADITEQQFQP